MSAMSRGGNGRDVAGLMMLTIAGLGATAAVTMFAWQQHGVVFGREFSHLQWPALGAGMFFTTIATSVAAWRRAERLRRADETRRYLAAVRKSHEVVEHMDGAVGVFAATDDGADFVVHEVNKAAGAMEQLARDQFVGRRLRKLSSGFGRPDVVAAVERVWRTGRSEKLAPFRHEGEEASLWVAGSAYRLGSGEVVVVIHDLTALKEAEEDLRCARNELELALDASHIGVWSWDFSRQLFRPDRRCAAMLGMTPGAPVADSAIRAKIHPDDLDVVLAEMGRAIEHRRDYEHDFRFAQRDGSWRHLCSRGRPIFDESGKLAQIVGCVWDMTERRRSEEHLQRAQRLASLGTLAGGVAHDLNNALAPLAMGLDLLARRTAPDSWTMETIETMAASVRRAAGIVTQLVTFTRGGGGRCVALHPRRALEELRATLEETFPSSIQIRFAAAESTLPVIQIDLAQLHHVLLNLCVNARDAMPRGGLLEISCDSVEIDAKRRAEFPELKAGRYVAFHVADTGSGIPAEIRDRIFDPFFTTKPVGHGSGLGLSTALGVVRAQGGAIRFDAREGGGTRFTVLLPVVYDERQPATAPAETPAGPGQGRARAVRDRTILVVDDEAPVRDLVRRGLEMEGARVLVASDGAEAVAAFARSPDAIDVVLMDLLMPVMNGAMATAAIRRIRSDTIVIAASGYATDAVVEEARKVGVSGFLAKPYEMKALLETLSAALAER